MTFWGGINYVLNIQASHENSSGQQQQINGKSTFSSNHIFRLALVLSVTQRLRDIVYTNYNMDIIKGMLFNLLLFMKYYAGK